MAGIGLGRLGGERAASRVIVLLRGSPSLVEPWLPPAEERELVGGLVLVAAAFVRRGRVGRFLARDRLAWLADGMELVPESPPRRFSHETDRFSLSLTVHSGEELELQLTAEACAVPEGSVFPSARAAAEFLERTAATQVDEGRVWEPLAPTAAHWRIPRQPDALQEALEFDSAYRQVARRLLINPSSKTSSAVQAAAARVRPLPSP